MRKQARRSLNPIERLHHAGRLLRAHAYFYGSVNSTATFPFSSFGIARARLSLFVVEDANKSSRSARVFLWNRQSANRLWRSETAKQPGALAKSTSPGQLEGLVPPSSKAGTAPLPLSPWHAQLYLPENSGS